MSTPACPAILIAVPASGQGPVKASCFHAWFASDPAVAVALFLKDQHAG